MRNLKTIYKINFNLSLQCISDKPVQMADKEKNLEVILNRTALQLRNAATPKLWF